jgi:hypothetical protein
VLRIRVEHWQHLVPHCKLHVPPVGGVELRPALIRVWPLLQRRLPERLRRPRSRAPSGAQQPRRPGPGGDRWIGCVWRGERVARALAEVSADSAAEHGVQPETRGVVESSMSNSASGTLTNSSQSESSELSPAKAQDISDGASDALHPHGW